MQSLTSNSSRSLLLLAGLLIVCSFSLKGQVNLEQYPNVVLSNGAVEMKVYLPDQEKGLYRATRFDWSGIIGSVKYKGHEYFGYWKKSHDPLYHDALTGPVEGFIEPGPGYAEAKPGEGFIRIGVGVIEKADEPAYKMFDTYRILDHGTWKIDKGDDWISFTHTIDSQSGYSYIYQKTIQLRDNGFRIEHTLQNRGKKPIETDQFNHNFFMIDHAKSGTAFQVSFPFRLSTDDDLKGLLKISGKKISFIKDLNEEESVFLLLNGYSNKVADHKVTVVNQKTGAGVTFTVDKPLYRMAFWTCQTTLCPENFIWLSVEPGEEEHWISKYTLFTDN